MKVARRVRPLTGEAVEGLPEPCRRCLFWELGEPRPDGSEDPEDAVARKQAWCAARGPEGGPPGRIVRVAGVIAAYALFAPAEELAPRGPGVPPASTDALLLATLWVDPELRGRGLGRLLLQAAIGEAGRLDLPAVEAYGDRRFRESRCVLPASWLLAEGFRVHRQHPRHPLLRVELSRTARWAQSLEQALEELLDRVPQPSPAPVPGVVSP